LSLRSPFADLTAPKIADHFRYLAWKFHADGKLGERYSVHDLRHADVAVTEAYLRSLGTGA
jgi:hypothetical protein